MEVLEAIQQRVLWLAVRMVDAANHERPDAGGIKVGGHQASSASIVSIMTALWFGFLGPDDKVAVKPHASPVLHAIQYLLGELDRSYLTRLRAFGGLQAYPSRTKDPDPVDFSTGSVGLGAAAPLFAAVTRRYVDSHFGPRPRSRFISLVGDAELDEGNVWEAINDPATEALGNVLWVVDLNRQSLDRVVPGIKAARLEGLFRDAGWHVVEAKYGGRLQQAFAEPGGEALRAHIDAMSNEQYQSSFARTGADLRDHFLEGGDGDVKRFLERVPDDDLAALLHNLGGHDLGELMTAYRAADAVTDRPSVVFAYTVKGWGLPIAGDPLNHAALLTTDHIATLRDELALGATTEWDRFPPGSPEGQLCAEVAARLHPPGPTEATDASSPGPSPGPHLAVPAGVGVATGRPVSTQEAFGRVLLGLARDEAVGPRLVTTSPDVAVSTNLGGWINRAGVFSPADVPDYLGEGRLLGWHQSPAGQHIELGISEMNLFLLLGQLGLAAELSGELLLPVGTVYDPFVARGLDAFIYSLYSGARFVVVGTPAGISLSPEGGAHQSTITASIGLELPRVTFAEPAYATALDWLLCDGLTRVADLEHGESMYLRLSTRPVDQSPFAAALARRGEDVLHDEVLAGGYLLVDATASARAGAAAPVTICASGPVVVEAVEAAAALADEGVAANVVDITSLDRLYRGWRDDLAAAVRDASRPSALSHLTTLFPGAWARAPIVTVHDASSHSMAWLGSALGTRVVPLGVDGFGQSGSIDELYRAYAIDVDAIVNATLVALELP
ncbi:MAG TPA: 1-deoxy-D-xylulose-5-phosphate synthase N-terminal domain-containing protein [Acidimicrobiales bacterium]|nr:1-deoxy-D-xylulose-5-phosphate synthase N-terminal domain-containing protein [Acidimicrobiales bacterium]